MRTQAEATASEQTVARVSSHDGTEIAYWTSGVGPPLVLVHGTTADHTRWRPLLPYLEPHATVHALDRRGRGASGETPAYDVAREFEDVDTVVDIVAADSGPVALLGHSYGGFCGLGAAGLTANLSALVLYEPAIGAAAPDDGLVERMEGLLAAGDREGALELMFREVVRMPDEEARRIREQPSWQARVAAAHTIPRELRAVTPEALEAARPEAVAVPVLLLAGGESPAYFRRDIDTVAAAVPDARVVVIDGQQHVADVLAPEVFAGHVLRFVGEHR
jgi:pimeloyl-ACP methyl ester carboxylesterase